MGQVQDVWKLGKAARNGGCVVLCALALTACGESGPAAGGGGADDIPRIQETVERDVEAPEVFSANEQGLWDGRPSLGGVWVAHPDVKDPERVLIRNTQTGKFVVGALFRRAREGGGPILQVSSDAAEALGMLAGAPAALNVTALRKEAAPLEAAVPAAQEEAGQGPDGLVGAQEEEVSAITPAPQTAVRPVSSLEKPFVQIGIFSVQGNAIRTAERMRAAGLIPGIKRGERGGKPFWRVIVGPANTASERSALLGKARAAGFSDAYAVTN